MINIGGHYHASQALSTVADLDRKAWYEQFNGMPLERKREELCKLPVFSHAASWIHGAMLSLVVVLFSKMVVGIDPMIFMVVVIMLCMAAASFRLLHFGEITKLQKHYNVYRVHREHVVLDAMYGLAVLIAIGSWFTESGFGMANAALFCVAGACQIVLVRWAFGKPPFQLRLSFMA